MEVLPAVIPKKGAAELSKATEALVRYLRSMTIGQFVSYADLSAVAHVDVRSHAKGNHHLYQARVILRRDYQMEFDTIKKVGIKRLNDSGCVAKAKTAIPRTHNAAKRGIQTLQCIRDFEGMTPEERVSHNTAMTLMGAMLEVTRAKGVQRLEKAVADFGLVLPLADTLQIFQKP